jgi:hypothetical protein
MNIKKVGEGVQKVLWMMNHMKTFMADFFNLSPNGYINRIIESFETKFETKRDLEIFNIYITIKEEKKCNGNKLVAIVHFLFFPLEAKMGNDNKLVIITHFLLLFA